MTSRWAALLILAGGIACGTGSSGTCRGSGGGGAPLRYSVTDLGALSFPVSINSRGQVSGGYCPGDETTCRGGVYTPGSGWVAAPVPPGAEEVTVVGVGPDGKLGLNAVFAYLSHGGDYVRAYTAAPLQPLPTSAQPPQLTRINAVHSATGHLVGYDEALGGGWLYRDGSLTPIANLPGTGDSGAGHGWALALNGRDQVVGWVRTGSDNHSPMHAFLWDQGQLKDLGTGGGSDSAAHAINECGVVTGSTRIGQPGQTQMFIWDGALTVVGCPPGLSSCAAQAINAGRTIVGDVGSDLVGDGQGWAFLYEGESFHLLKDLATDAASWEFFSARSINDAGQIVGVGRLGLNPHGYLLTPK